MDKIRIQMALTAVRKVMENAAAEIGEIMGRAARTSADLISAIDTLAVAEASKPAKPVEPAKDAGPARAKSPGGSAAHKMKVVPQSVRDRIWALRKRGWTWTDISSEIRADESDSKYAERIAKSPRMKLSLDELAAAQSGLFRALSSPKPQFHKQEPRGRAHALLEPLRELRRDEARVARLCRLLGRPPRSVKSMLSILAKTLTRPTGKIRRSSLVLVLKDPVIAATADGDAECGALLAASTLPRKARGSDQAKEQAAGDPLV